ncbi:MAG: hypothetical protein GTO51_07225 [Candidatus Latescibacteria bacterium]|nr:hypothetical protein [Candidatus Latescibacterota bacterium]NIM22285.1 hypothetical protein [Candidatus Latescibacterota bacterium]NIM65764.1 hypothetical protein [Candidatus Latescibacterota bacterium]NIO02149.1 hypothetical protein [Candidatus Latescibacterota bacterium]NIO28981.1 hypothetical protein [Candidatus Latescibacterota bacterium]
MKRFASNLAWVFIFFSIFWLCPNLASSNEKNTHLVRIPYKSPAQIRSLFEQGMDVLSFSPKGYIDVAANPKQLEDLLYMGVPLSVIGTPEMTFASPALDENLGDYHTFDEMKTALLTLESTYPTLASLQSLGLSHELKPIYALKVSDNVAVDESEPEVLIMGCHHARELMSVEIPLRFAEYLLANYGALPEVTALVDAREIYFVPMVNPDGHYYVQQNHGGAWWTWWRKNRRDNGDGTYGVDLNRNYSYQWGYDDIGSSPSTSSDLYRGPAPFSEPETQAIRDLCIARDFVFGFSYHSYGELLLYPWSYYPGYTPDHELFYELGDSLSSSNGYLQGNAAMGAIYIVNGDTDDWAYGEDTEKNSFLNFTPEVNTYEEGGFGPPDTLIVPTFNKLLMMNMLLLELVDNPHRVLGPYAPTMYPIDDPFHPIFTLSWSGNDPSDPNPAVSYELIEYKNLSAVPQDAAESLSPLWNFNGFQIGGRAYEGFGSYYSGSGDNLYNDIETAMFYQVTEDTDSFSCWVWYDIESNYDYAYCEVSTDEGLIWTPIPGNITTDYDPYGSNRGNGITGSSGGWIQAIFPMDDYLNSDIRFRFTYITDGFLFGEGIYFDLLGPLPTSERATLLGSSIPDTTYMVIPSEIGEYTYRVRANDLEGQVSRWSSTVSIMIDDVSAASSGPPLTSYLGANYPNPFNPFTQIPFAVGEEIAAASVRVTLKIYSASGSLVATLVNDSFPSGYHLATWMGRDDSGQPVASGVYFARLTVGASKAFTRKLVLLK